MSKNYICFVNDHSGSMLDNGKAEAARKDYNATISVIKDAATREMLDTVVSVVGVGLPDHKRGTQVLRQVVASNPHVLKPMDTWPTPGGTPLYDGIADMIALCESLPDANEPHVSFLVQITTDGEECSSRRETKITIAQKIKRVQDSGRWTFVARIPKGNKHWFSGLGIPDGNIIEWTNDGAGLEVATAQNKVAMDNYFVLRSAGAKSSSVFYANAAAVDTSKLVDISNKVSLYVVEGPDVQEGIQIRDFILKRRTQYLKGAAFYQLTKTESKIAETKLVVVRDRTNGKIYGGQQARTMVNLPKFGNARLHPGDHKNYDIFIQSESVNRKLVKGTGVIYWEEMGVPFTQEELERFLAPAAPVVLPPKPAIVQLPAVPVSFKPTPSPIPVSKLVQLPHYNGRPINIFAKRSDARKAGSLIDLKKVEWSKKVGVGPNDRWAVFA
jgi:hypothetical protein